MVPEFADAAFKLKPGEVSEPVEPVRDADGRVDIKGTMQAITTVIEGWIRQYPEQWLWLHRRWR